MSMNLVTLLYLVASVCFIQALKGLSHPTTSIRGNLFGMIGMTIAALTTGALIWTLSTSTLALGWERIHYRLEFTHNDKFVVMDHYPLESWNKKYHGSIHLFGHVHDEQADRIFPIKNRFNICVEKTNYFPVNLDFYTKGQ